MERLWSNRFMRVIVFFDLPTLTSEDRKNANAFRKSLLKDGFVMIQLSIYSRICRGIYDVDKHIQRVRSFIPKKGSIRVLTITEKQYSSIQILLGTRKKNEEFGEQQVIAI